MGQSFKGIASAQTSITGKLDGEYSPVEFKGQANLQLEGLTTQLKQPSIKIKNLNTQVNFPFEFNTKLGAQVPYLNIHTDFQNAEVLDTFQVNAFELDTKMVMKEFHNLKPEFGTFPGMSLPDGAGLVRCWFAACRCCLGFWFRPRSWLDTRSTISINSSPAITLSWSPISLA